MNAVIHHWQHWPSSAELVQCWQQHQTQQAQQPLYWHIHTDRLPESHCFSPEHADFNQRLQQALRYWQPPGHYCIPHLLPNSTLMLLPAHESAHTPGPPWLAAAPALPVTHVAVVGAGIAGAATAYALAQRGVAVTVLEAGQAAQAASGNRQGLLYAKIAAHSTAQTELLLAAYGYSRQLLDLTLPESHGWHACGVLHLNHNSSEQRRNQQLAQQQPHSTLYQAVSAAEAGILAGIPINQSGLWWPHGAWLHPPAWVNALLAHPNIRLHEYACVENTERHHHTWQISYRQHGQAHTLAASHVVLCGGAASARLPLLHGWPFQPIRGQTSTARAGVLAQQLRCALSGASYISPAWQGQVCFGASFVPNDAGHDWRAAEQQHNWHELHRLNPALAADLHIANPDNHQTSGHAAVRCDSFDHLPVVGAVGDAAAMRQIYAKLAHDKNQCINIPCPWLPGIYVNTAHGSRGLATAPLCGEAVAAAILGLPSPLSPRLQHALHPNRLVIRSLTHHQPWPL